MKRNNLELFTNASNVNCNSLSEIDHCFDIDETDNCGNSFMEIAENNSFACKWNSGSNNGTIKSRCEPNFSGKCIKNTSNTKSNPKKDEDPDEDPDEGPDGEKSGNYTVIIIIIIIVIIGGGLFYMMNSSSKSSSKLIKNKAPKFKSNDLNLNTTFKK
jgi:hypothetical protein